MVDVLITGDELKVLIVRNDKLGDFMLAYPSFALLKVSVPGAKVLALVPEYTREMAEMCPWLDGVIADSGEGALDLARVLRGERFDAVVALYSTIRVGIASLLAGIPHRFAPATKIAQIFFNHRLKQRRSLSEKPEFEYNLDLIREYLRNEGVEIGEMPAPPYLHFEANESAVLEEAFRTKQGIARGARLVFVHPGSGGSAGNLSLEQFARLSASLQSDVGHVVVITAGPGEVERANSLSSMIEGRHHVVYVSDRGLKRFAQHIQFADLFISGSTGTLHIAGALDRPTAAFYTRRRSATALRWRTLNSPERRLAFSPPEEGDAEDMSGIDLEAAAREISERFLQTVS